MINKQTIELIKQFEGCKLTAYLCPANIPTIGYGHTHDVKLGDRITLEESERLLINDLMQFETQVKKLVTVPITNNQLGALVSFAYNVGVGNLKSSTLLKKVNSKDRLAADEFLKWDKSTANGKKVALAGLTKRRKAERELYLS
jgi:lysozyme